MQFADREEAGTLLADKLADYKQTDSIIIALPRGGVVTGVAVAQKLKLPFDILIVRKIGSPFNAEYGIGAIAEDGTTYIDEETVMRYEIPHQTINKIIKQEKSEIERRIVLYRNGKKQQAVQGKNVLLVDDGLATGASATAAILSLRRKNPAKLMLAVPGCPQDVADEMKKLADEFISLIMPPHFEAVGQLYKKFPQVSDEEVLEFLKTMQHQARA